MSGAFDGFVEWGEELFYRPVISQRPRKNVSGLFAIVHFHHRSATSRENRVRQTLMRTTARVPEVIVKISGSGRGMHRIKVHFEYISRNGQVDLENQDGDLIAGHEAVRDLQDEWRYGLYGIPEESHKREAFNIVLSMPPGTSRELVKRAVRDFAKSEFSRNHQFVFASHEDEKHPHVHLCVKALGIDGTRLNPRKGDLQLWREGFAEKLREHGVAANATPRRSRGVLLEYETQSLVHMRKRGVIDLREGDRSEISSARGALSRAESRVVAAYHRLARSLASSNDVHDRKLAVGIVAFVRQMPMISIGRDHVAVIEKDQVRVSIGEILSPIVNGTLEDRGR